MMEHAIEINIVSDDDIPLPSKDKIETILNRTLNSLDIGCSEVSVAIVDELTMQGINQEFREKDKSTNVLSFPASIEEDVFSQIDDVHLNSQCKFIGDIICCPKVIQDEAEQYEVELEARWAHMLIHGVLHLIGMDHMEEQERTEMEAKEKELMNQLNYPDPYIV